MIVNEALLLKNIEKKKESIGNRQHNVLLK